MLFPDVLALILSGLLACGAAIGVALFADTVIADRAINRERAARHARYLADREG